MKTAVDTAPPKGSHASARGFPVYRELAGKLADPGLVQPDRIVARALATAAMYAYADDGGVLHTAMARLGFGDGCSVTPFREQVDAMLVASTGFLIQSEDRRVAIVAYRGTPVTNVITWMADLDMRPDRIHKTQISIDGRPHHDNDRCAQVHEGIYRNVRATKYDLGEALKRAERDGMEALYITGHSLGGSMAVMLGFLLGTDRDPELLEIFQRRARGVYTYGQPALGDKRFAEAAAEAGLAQRLFRYRYRRDFATATPPRDARLRFVHFGPEYNLKDGWTEEPGKNTQPMESLLGIAEAALTFFSEGIRGLEWIPHRLSLYDHLPANYVSQLTVDGEMTVFGDEGRI